MTDNEESQETQEEPQETQTSAETQKTEESELTADGTSIFHVNCKHRMVVWKPGLSDLR